MHSSLMVVNGTILLSLPSSPSCSTPPFPSFPPSFLLLSVSTILFSSLPFISSPCFIHPVFTIFLPLIPLSLSSSIIPFCFSFFPCFLHPLSLFFLPLPSMPTGCVPPVSKLLRQKKTGTKHPPPPAPCLCNSPPRKCRRHPPTQEAATVQRVLPRGGKNIIVGF